MILSILKNKRAEGGMTWGYTVAIILALIGLIVIVYAMVKAGKLGGLQLGGLR
jgi:hypothetical protein